LFRQYVQYGYWKVRVIQKHKVPASPRHLVPASFVLILSVLLLSSIWFSVAAWSTAGLVTAYAISSLAASIHTVRRSDWKLLPFMPMIFACYHFGYGCGFLHGVWDFLVLHRRPRATYAVLTRLSRGR
jgi:hypothetical protein